MKKGAFISYQMVEAIKMIQQYDLSNKDDRLFAEQQLNVLKERWYNDVIPGYNVRIEDKIAGMQELTIDGVLEFIEKIKNVDILSTECCGNMQYCMVRDSEGNINFDFKYLEEIASFARDNEKKIVIDSAIVFGDHFPENMSNMNLNEIVEAISKYTQELTSRFGDCIERIDVLNSIFQRKDVLNNSKAITVEQFWINYFGKNYPEKVSQIVKSNMQDQKIKLGWNEFYITNQNIPQKRKDFIKKIKETPSIDVVGLQDNFRSDSDINYIIKALNEVLQNCSNNDKELSITELSCKLSRKDIDVLFEAKNNGTYNEKVVDLNKRISSIIEGVTEFAQKSDILSLEARVSDEYDPNHEEAKKYGFDINTSISRDEKVDKPLDSRSGLKDEFKASLREYVNSDDVYEFSYDLENDKDICEIEQDKNSSEHKEFR